MSSGSTPSPFHSIYGPKACGRATTVPTFNFEPPSTINDVVVLPSGGFATADDDSNVRRWSADGALEAVLPGHDDIVSCLAVRVSGGIVSGSLDSSVRVWEADACVSVLAGAKDWVTAVAVHPHDDNVVLSGGHDEAVSVWDVATGARTAVFRGHTARVFCLCVLHDGTVVSGSSDSTVRLWDVDGNCKAILNQSSQVFDVAPCASSDAFIAVGGFGGTRSLAPLGFVTKWRLDVRQWSVVTDAPVFWVCTRPFATLSTHGLQLRNSDGEEVGSVSWSSQHPAAFGDGRLLLLGGGSGHVVQWSSADRLGALRVLSTAWSMHSGVPPPRPAAATLVAAVARTLCLRRLCRTRGEDGVGMPEEVVEPFGREVVNFL